MKLSKLVSLVLAFAMVLTIFCGITLTASAETVVGHVTYTSETYTAAKNVSVADSEVEDATVLNNMKYVYFYTKGSAGNTVNFVLKDADGTWWCADTTGSNATTITTTGSVSADKVIRSGFAIYFSTSFEGYVILNIADEMKNHSAYKGKTEGFDITTMASTGAYEITAECFGNIGFAATLGDAKNAISAKLGLGTSKGTYSSDIIPMNIREYAPANAWVSPSNYQTDNANLANAKYLGFRLKATNYNFYMQLADASDNRYTLKNESRTQYTVSANGTVTTVTASNNSIYGTSFDGWVILPVADFLRSGVAISPTSIAKIYVSPAGTDSSVTVGNFALSTADTVDSLVDYYTASEEEEETPVDPEPEVPADTTVKAYATFDSGVYTAADKTCSMNLLEMEDASELADMKYFYFYYKTTAAGNSLNIGLNDGDGTRWAPMTAQTDKGFATVSSSDGKYTAKNANIWGNGSGGIYPNSSFEGYVIIDIANDFSLHGSYKGSDSVFDITTLKTIAVWNSKAECYGDFGFAATKGDAVNAILTKLGKGELNSTYDSEIIPANVVENYTAGGIWINNYQSDNAKLANAKFIGFRLKTDADYNFNIQLVETANSGTRFGLKNAERTYYTVTADGTLKTKSAGNNAFYGSAFDGWVIFPLSDFINNSGTAINAASIVQAYMSPNAESKSVTIGDFAFSTADTPDSLAAYYTAITDTASTAIAVNKIGGNLNMLEDSSAIEGKKWFGLKLTSTDESEQTVKWAIRISSVTDNYALNVPAGASYYLVTDNGVITNKTASAYADLTVPAGFNGYLVVKTNTLGSQWNNATADKIAEYQRVGFFSGTYTNITLSTPVFADTFAALYDEYTAIAADDYKDNTYLINKNSLTIGANPDSGTLANLKSDTTDAVNMQWFGFRLKATASNNYFKLYVYEEDVEKFDEDGLPVYDEDGNIEMQRECWWTNSTEYYLVTKAGKITEGKIDSNGQLWTPDGAAFDGYLIMPVSSLTQHTGNYLGNKQLDLDEITTIKFDSSSYGLTAERISMAETRDELIEYLANAEMLYSYENRGNVNGDEAIDARDIVRYKKYVLGVDVEMTTENMDVNGDEDIDLAIELVALRKLILNK